MTIEEVFIRDEICILTRNICIANQIKTFNDLKRHYIESGTFRNLLYCDEKSNDVLIDVYKKYKDLFIESKTTQPVSINKSEVKLEDVVTDLDEVNKTTHTTNSYLEEIERKLKVHWSEVGKKTAQIETAKSSVKGTLKRDAVDLKSIEQKLEEYWRANAEKEVPSIKTVFDVTNVVDLDEAKQTIEAYRRNQVCDEVTGSIDTTNLELEQRPKKQWRERANIKAKESHVKSKSTFGRHPSKRLNDLYLIKNYQGANPIDAKVIFVGRDPNWAADIDERKMFESVVEYLTDGIAFWEKHNIHHPFLLSGYKGDGRKYHRNFSRMNLDSSVANKISFVELIGFPTTGMAGSNSTLFKQYLFSDANRENLRLLNKVLNDPNKIIFIAWGLTANFKAIYNKTGLLRRFAEIDKRGMNRKKLNKVENVYIHPHFSDSIYNATLAEMEKKVKQHFL